MIKSDLINKCRELNIIIPFRIIIDLYKDEDEIPNELIKILFESPKKQEFVIYGNAEFCRVFEEAIFEEIKKKYIKNG